MEAVRTHSLQLHTCVRKRESKLQFVFSCFSSAFLDDVSIFLQALYYFHSKMCGASCTHGFPGWCRLQQDHSLIPASPWQSTCQSVGHQAQTAAAAAAAASCVLLLLLFLCRETADPPKKSGKQDMES